VTAQESKPAAKPEKAGTVTTAQNRQESAEVVTVLSQPQPAAVPTGGTSAATQSDQADSAEAKPVLSASLKDISGSAKLRGRQGLESMNKVTVTIREAVALRITDSRGKTLANGSYKSGDKVTVNGIPPIRIAVSDSAKIKVSYMGGQVTVPARQQVSFNLPTE
jgi:cytoskeletal protein RodZ